MFKKTIKKIIFLMFALGFIANVAFANQVINSIEVIGNSRVSELTIKAVISYREGDEISEENKAEIIRELYETGNFQNVSVDLNNGKLLIKVQENPVYNNFVFKGNKIIKTEELMQVVGVKIRSVYSKRSERTALENVKQFYKIRGYYSAKIKVKKVKKSNNRIDLEFDINEGGIATIKNINFIGNEFYSDSALRDVILSKEDAWWRFLSDDDIYDKGRVEVDKQALNNYYRNRGFADVKIISVNAELSKDKKDFFLTYKLNEGKRYKIGKVYVTNWMSGVNKKKIRDMLTDAGSGGYFNAKSLNSIMNEVSKELAVQGVPFALLEPKLNKYSKGKENYVDINFQMKKNRKIFVQKIVIRGNTRTLDRVIRKELELVEGDPFNATILRTSETNIRKLGFFQDVNITFKEGSTPNKAIVYIDVKEKSTGSAGFGAGYSTADGVVFKITVSENNFLGRGQKVSTSLMRNGRDLGGSFSFTEPYFMGHNVEAGFSVSRKSIDRMKRHSYKAKENKISVSAEYDINRKWSQLFAMSYRDYDVYEVASSASLSVKSEQGRTRGYSLIHKLSYTDVDDYFNPTSGYKTRLSTNMNDMSTKFKHIYYDLRGSYYYPLSEKMVLTLSSSVTRISGYENLRFIDRLYLNSDYIRGFDKVGPMDKKSNDLLGGTKRFTAGAEIDFSVGLPASMGIKGSVFFNHAKLSGTPKHKKLEILGDGDIRQSIGAGIKWASPIGPMRFDFTKVLKKGGLDETRSFQFTVGFGIN